MSRRRARSLSESSIDLIFAPAYGSSKKNATDIRLAIDAAAAFEAIADAAERSLVMARFVDAPGANSRCYQRRGDALSLTRGDDLPLEAEVEGGATTVTREG